MFLNCIERLGTRKREAHDSQLPSKNNLKEFYGSFEGDSYFLQTAEKQTQHLVFSVAELHR